MKTFIFFSGLAALACAQLSSSLVDSRGAPRIIKNHQEVVDAATKIVDASASAMRREALIQTQDTAQLQERLQASEAKSQALEDKLGRMEELLTKTQGRLELLEKKVAEAQSGSVMYRKKMDPSLLDEGTEEKEEGKEQHQTTQDPPWPFEVSNGDSRMLVLKGWNLHIVADSKAAAGEQRGNLIVGTNHNYAESTNGLVAGTGNTVKNDGSVALGGKSCLAEKGGATLGGEGGQATGIRAVVVGGQNDAGTGSYSVAIGGASNEAKVEDSGVFGGNTLTADDQAKFQFPEQPATAAPGAL